MRGGALFAIAVLAALPLDAQPAKPADDLAPIELNCDALRWTGSLDKKTNDELGPAHSLAEAEAILKRHKVPFTRSRGMLSMSMAESEVKSIATLPQGEPIVFPDAQGGTVCALVPSADSV